MSSPPADPSWSEDLPSHVRLALENLIAAARESFGAELRSVVMFGSGAEGRLRATSDVNVMVILKRFGQAEVDRFRDPLRVAHAAAKVAVMMVLEDELEDAGGAFAVKFADIVRRHRILWGDDLLGGLVISRVAQVQRLKQVVLNTLLRLRERYAMVSLREEHLALTIADTAGPLRSAAASLLELEGTPAKPPREALRTIAMECGKENWLGALESVSQAREGGSLPPGKAAEAMFALMEICAHLRQRLNQLAC